MVDRNTNRSGHEVTIPYSYREVFNRSQSSLEVTSAVDVNWLVDRRTPLSMLEYEKYGNKQTFICDDYLHEKSVLICLHYDISII